MYKQKIVAYVTIMLLAFACFFGIMTVPVVGEDFYDNLDFDDYQVGIDVGSSTHGDWRLIGHANNVVVTHSVNGSTKSGRVYDNGFFEFNTSYTEGTLTNSTSFFMDFKFYTVYDTWSYWHYYLYDENDVLIYHLYLYHVYSGGSVWDTYLKYYDANTSFEVLSKGFFGVDYGDTFHEWQITVSKNGIWAHGDKFRTIIKDEGTTILDCNYSSMVWDGDLEYFTSMKLLVGNIGNAWQDCYLQDIQFTQYGFEDYSNAYQALAGYDYWGMMPQNGLFSSDQGFGGKRWLEERRMIKMSTTVRAVDLVVSRSMHDDDPDLSNYWCLVGNGWNSAQQHGTEWFTFGSNYVVRFKYVNLTLTNEHPRFTFQHAVALLPEPLLSYWEVGIVDYDIDNDGALSFRWHDDAGLLDAEYNGDLYPLARDLNYRFYFDKDTIYTTDCDGSDLITIELKSEYMTFALIPITYVVSTKAYNNYITIYKDGSEITYQDFPMRVDDCDGTTSFTPIETGDYVINLLRNSVNVSSYSFTVIDDPDADKYRIYTLPGLTSSGEEYNVYAYYNHGSKDGALFMQYTPDLVDPFYAAQQHYFHESTDFYYNITYTQYTRMSSYWLLCIETSNDSYLPIKTHIHLLRGESTGSHIAVSYPNINFEIDKAYGIQHASGYHSHVGADVRILDNGEMIRAVRYESTFSFSYNVYEQGDHRVQLVIETANGTVYLANTSFTFGEAVTDEDTEVDLLDFVGEYKPYLALIIIILLMLVPIAIEARGFVSLPLIVYIGFGATGVAFSVAIGLVDTYWVLLIVIALVAGAVISVFNK